MVSPEVLELRDVSRPSWDGSSARPVRAHLWRTRRVPAGTVVVSHGTGGAAEGMAWLAEPLAEAGFLAVAVDHHGNNYVDGYLPEGFAFWWERPRDLSFVLDSSTPRGRPARRDSHSAATRPLRPSVFASTKPRMARSSAGPRPSRLRPSTRSSCATFGNV